jgi:hypothetical protein
MGRSPVLRDDGEHPARLDWTAVNAAPSAADNGGHMGDVNQFIFAQRVFKGFAGRVLEIGSKDYGDTQPFRELFKHCDYVGVDLESGVNVDQVVNLEEDLGPLRDQKFDLIIICSVLEHSPKPWVMASNIQNLLSEQGVIYSCHPWVWRYHKYPDDYFRFSPKGIQAIFDQVTLWLPSMYSTYKPGEFLSFSQDEGIDNKMAQMDNQGRKYLPYLQTVIVGTRDALRFANLYEAYLEMPSDTQA